MCGLWCVSLLYDGPIDIHCPCRFFTITNLVTPETCKYKRFVNHSLLLLYGTEIYLLVYGMREDLLIVRTAGRTAVDLYAPAATMAAVVCARAIHAWHSNTRYNSSIK